MPCAYSIPLYGPIPAPLWLLLCCRLCTSSCLGVDAVLDRRVRAGEIPEAAASSLYTNADKSRNAFVSPKPRLPNERLCVCAYVCVSQGTGYSLVYGFIGAGVVVRLAVKNECLRELIMEILGEQVPQYSWVRVIYVYKRGVRGGKLAEPRCVLNCCGGELETLIGEFGGLLMLLIGLVENFFLGGLEYETYGALWRVSIFVRLRSMMILSAVSK